LTAKGHNIIVINGADIVISMMTRGAT